MAASPLALSLWRWTWTSFLGSKPSIWTRSWRWTMPSWRPCSWSSKRLWSSGMFERPFWHTAGSHPKWSYVNDPQWSVFAVGRVVQDEQDHQHDDRVSSCGFHVKGEVPNCVGNGRASERSSFFGFFGQRDPLSRSGLRFVGLGVFNHFWRERAWQRLMYWHYFPRQGT